MSATQAPTNLAEMVRDRAKSRGDALVYEFEGRQTSFAEFDIKTNRVANALIALGIKPGERIAYLGKNSDIYFELLMGAMKANVVMAPVNWRLAGPEVAFIVDDCKAPVLFVGPEFITQVRNILPQLPSLRTVITTEGGAPEWQDFTAWRDAQSGDDPKVEGRRTKGTTAIRRTKVRKTKTEGDPSDAKVEIRKSKAEGDPSDAKVESRRPKGPRSRGAAAEDSPRWHRRGFSPAPVPCRRGWPAPGSRTCFSRGFVILMSASSRPSEARAGTHTPCRVNSALM